MCEKEIMIPSLPYPAGKEPEVNDVMARPHRDHAGKKEMRVPTEEKHHENESETKTHEMTPRRNRLDAPVIHRAAPREDEPSQHAGGEGVPAANAAVVQAEPLAERAAPDTAADASDATTDTDDANVVTYAFVLGKYQTHIPNVGTFFQFLKTTPGYIICIFLPFLLLIMIQGVNSIKLFRRYKAEQLADMRAERDALEAERLKSQEMMAELLRMREQMGLNNSSLQEGKDDKAE